MNEEQVKKEQTKEKKQSKSSELLAEIEKLKAEAAKAYGTGKKLYRQAGAYILMLNTGLRAGEMLGVLNSDIDLERRILHVQRGVKVINKRDGVELLDGSTEVKVGKLKSTTSKRDIPLNDTAIKMIQELQQEYYFGEDSPLICDEKGNYTNPDVFRRRYHRLLEGAGIESKGLHSLRHTFATNLVNGVKQPDGTIKALTVTSCFTVSEFISSFREATPIRSSSCRYSSRQLSFRLRG